MPLDKKQYKIPVKYFIILFTLLIIFNIADIVSTFQVIGMGAFEGNPFARWLFGWSGLMGAIFGKIFMLVVVISCLLIARTKNELIALTLLAFVVGITAATVYSNFLIFLNLTFFPPL
jgi:hypothetical protein